MIRAYTHPLLTGKPCMIHDEFVKGMDLFCRYLELTGCRALITSSHRINTEVSGAIVRPAKVSNHLVGCAIDCNIYDKGGKSWDSKALNVFSPEHKNFNPSINNEVLQFINLVRRSHILRWGGDFHPDKDGNTDPVHFDNAINLTNRKRYDEIINELYKKPLTP